MFDNLSDRLEGAFKVLQGIIRLPNSTLRTSKQIRRALVEADVSFKIAKQFTNDVEAKALVLAY